MFQDRPGRDSPRDSGRGGQQTDPDRRFFLRAGAVGACTLCLSMLGGIPRPVEAQSAQRGLINRRRSRWFDPLERGNLECTLCPKRCHIAPGGRGRCRVRENQNGVGYSLVYGTPTLVQLDPVERKPFFHVMPGTRALSISTAGCPLECRFCEVWDMALVSPEDVHAYDLPPRKVIEHAVATNARSVSYAFGEPVAFYEYMHDTARLARQAGLRNLLHTSGYIEPEPLEALADTIDAVNVDLKSFDPDFYRNLCGGELDPVLDCLVRLKRAGVHIEITNLVIPTLNDNVTTITRMCRWIHDELGADTPLHFARFYPLYKLANLPPTPVSTLDRARATAHESGLHYVYVARVTGHDGENTRCPECGEVIVRRLGFVIEEIRMNEGRCSFCGRPTPGLWS